jgi:RNA recognition motif-containing protein
MIMVALFVSVLSSLFGQGVSRGFGFISYDTFEASDAALAGMNGCEAKKRKGTDGKGRKRKESLDVADCPPD